MAMKEHVILQKRCAVQETLIALEWTFQDVKEQKMYSVRLRKPFLAVL